MRGSKGCVAREAAAQTATTALPKHAEQQKHTEAEGKEEEEDLLLNKENTKRENGIKIQTVKTLRQ